MAFTNDWTETTPLGSENANTADDYLRDAKVDLGERLESMFCGFNHDDHAGDEDEYGVKHLKFFPEDADPTTDSDYGFLYVKSDGTTNELFWKDGSANVKQLTDGGVLKVVAGDYAADSIDEDDIQLANTGMLQGEVAATGSSADIIGLNADDVPELADGAVLAAATEAGDDDLTVANKKYVDDEIDDRVGTIGDMSPSDYQNDGGGDSRESVTYPNGMIVKSGYVAYSSEAQTITFDAAFPYGIVSVQVTPADTDSNRSDVAVGSLAVGSFVVYVGTNHPDGFYWEVKGY